VQRLHDLPEYLWLAAARRQATVVIFGMGTASAGIADQFRIIRCWER
jgi:hypothetical protein